MRPGDPSSPAFVSGSGERYRAGRAHSPESCQDTAGFCSMDCVGSGVLPWSLESRHLGASRDSCSGGKVMFLWWKRATAAEGRCSIGG